MKKLFILIAIVGLVSCGSRTTKNTDKTASEQGKLIGGDKDEHGCLTSAGYSWSEVRQECIRFFETGVKFTSATDANATSAAFAVFSADSLKAELSIPGQDKNDILTRKPCEKCGYVWTNDAANAKSLYKFDGTWGIAQGETVLYKQSVK